MDERTLAEVLSTAGQVKGAALDLRERGYDATVWIEDRGDHFTVEIRVRVPPLGIPVEAVHV